MSAWEKKPQLPKIKAVLQNQSNSPLTLSEANQTEFLDSTHPSCEVQVALHNANSVETGSLYKVLHPKTMKRLSWLRGPPLGPNKSDAQQAVGTSRLKLTPCIWQASY